jgi:hypothetical protein
MPREVVTIVVSQLSPLAVEAQFFAILAEPLDARARKKLIEAEYRLLEPQMRYLGSEDEAKLNKLAAKRHKRAVQVIERERLLAAEYANARIAERVVKSAGAKGLELRADGEPIGDGRLTMQNYALWAVSKQHELAGRPDPAEGTWKTFQQRAWRNSKPVVHLVLGWHWAARSKTSDAVHVRLAVLFADPDATKAFFDVCEQLRGVLLGIAQDGRIELEEKDTVRLIAR